MKRNVASQVVCAQMITAADGSDFTGAVSVFVTGDGGTKTAGGGTVTHEGDGQHSYAPTQAETNYAHVAFQFKATGAVTATIQVYPNFPQTGDSFGLIGTTGSGLTSLATQASVNAVDDLIDTEVAAIKAVVDAILVDTAEIGAAGAGLTALATQASVNTIDDFLDTEVAAIKAKTDNLPASFPSNFASLSITAGGLVDITQAAADKVWATTARLLTAGTNIVLAKGTGVTGFNDLDAPGAAAAVWNAAVATYGSAGSYGLLIETNLDAAVSSVGGGGGVADWTADEKSAIRSILGIPASGTTPDDPTTGILDTIRDAAVAVKTKTDNLPSDPADASDIAASFTALSAKVDTVDDLLDTEMPALTVAVGAIKTKTDNLPADPADASDIAAAFTALSAKVDTVDDLLDTEMPALTAAVASVQADTNDIQTRLPAALVGGRMDSNLSAIGNSTTTLTAFQRAVKTNVIGTVGGGSTTTSIVSSSLTPAGSVTDQFKGLTLKFADDTTTAALRGQGTSITGNTASATPTFAVTALTTAPVSTDTFVVV